MVLPWTFPCSVFTVRDSAWRGRGRESPSASPATARAHVACILICIAQSSAQYLSRTARRMHGPPNRNPSEFEAPRSLRVGRRGIAHLLFEFRPACVEGFQVFLRRFHRGIGNNQPVAVTANRGTFQLVPSLFPHLLRILNPLLPAAIPPRSHEHAPL